MRGCVVLVLVVIFLIVLIGYCLYGATIIRNSLYPAGAVCFSGGEWDTRLGPVQWASSVRCFDFILRLSIFSTMLLLLCCIVCCTRHDINTTTYFIVWSGIRRTVKYKVSTVGAQLEPSCKYSRIVL